jgi:hypothetical protein
MFRVGEGNNMSCSYTFKFSATLHQTVAKKKEARDGGESREEGQGRGRAKEGRGIDHLRLTQLWRLDRPLTVSGGAIFLIPY